MSKAPVKVGEYTLGQTLGSGSSGKVKLAEGPNGEIVAIKVIKLSQFEDKPDVLKRIRREIALMALLDHPNLLKLIEVLESSRCLYIVLEYASNGELLDFMLNRQSISIIESMCFFRQLIFGLEHLHSLGICHRDLKPENILIDSSKQVKIGDFGFARWMRSNIVETSCGSPHYVAPEIIRGERYDGRIVDVWSCGVILFALVSVSFSPVRGPGLSI